MTLNARNGYTRLPTREPDTSGSTSYGAASAPALGTLASKRKKAPRNLKPGLFYQFGERGKYATSHVSTARDGPSDSDGERIELMEFRPRKPRTKRGRLKSPKSPAGTTGSRARPKITIEEPILQGDTLQRVSLRYSCPVSEIKRVNNLYNDQDFFALKTIKIPIREHSVLTEMQMREKCRKNNVEEVSENHSSGGATSDEKRLVGGPSTYYKSDEEGHHSSGDADDEVGDSDGPEYRDVSIQSALKWKHSSRALLNKFDEELQKIRENTEQKQMTNLREVSLRIESPSIHPIMPPNAGESYGNKLFSFNWTTGGIILLFIVILAVVFFLTVMFLYIMAKIHHWKEFI